MTWNKFDLEMASIARAEEEAAAVARLEALGHLKQRSSDAAGKPARQED